MAKQLGENEFTETLAVGTSNYELPYQVMSHDKVALDLRARLALAMLERWGPVLAVPDGEDAAGRAKTRDLTARETVQKAISIADIAYVAFAENGWLVHIGSMSLDKYPQR